MVGAPHVFLVVEPLLPQRGHRRWMSRQQPREILPLPEGVVGRVIHHAGDERQLVEAAAAYVVARGTGPKVLVVLVEGVARRHGARSLLHRLHVHVAEHQVAEGAVVEPVVAHVRVNHRAFRYRGLQGGMRIEQSHRRGEALVRRADHADVAIGFRYVLHQPIDGVVRVGNVVHLRRVQRPAHGPHHHVLAFRAVLAAHVLVDTDIAGLDELGVAERQCREHRRGLGVTRALFRVIRRARQQDRCVVRALGHHDDGLQLHTIAHGDHHHALDEILAARDHVVEGPGNVVGADQPSLLRWIRRSRLRHGWHDCGKETQQTHFPLSHPHTLVLSLWKRSKRFPPDLSHGSRAGDSKKR